MWLARHFLPLFPSYSPGVYHHRGHRGRPVSDVNERVADESAGITKESGVQAYGSGGQTLRAGRRALTPGGAALTAGLQTYGSGHRALAVGGQTFGSDNRASGCGVQVLAAGGRAFATGVQAQGAGEQAFVSVFVASGVSCELNANVISPLPGYRISWGVVPWLPTAIPSHAFSVILASHIAQPTALHKEVGERKYG